MSEAAQRMQARLAGLLDAGWDASQIAAAAAQDWRSIEGALAPVVGARGFAALLARSLRDIGGDFPWAASPRGAAGDDTLAALQLALSRHTPAETIAANAALLHCFCAVLGSLIGAALTERLLHSVGGTSNRGEPAQESPQ
jgi:hypothetical protein